jgi:photosystem II stability/assembly factor-like uncharacterized protein
MILGPSAGSSGNDGRIELSSDGGRSWHQVSERWQRNMVERFKQADDALFAVMANGELLSTKIATQDWKVVLADVTGINDLAFMEA